MTLDDGNGHYVIVVGNLDPNVAHDLAPGYPVTGNWYKYNGDLSVDGSIFTVNNLTDMYHLNASEVFILTNFEIDPCLEVVNDKDNGYGSLREAISCAMSGDTILFDYGVWNDTIGLQTPLVLDKDLYFLEKNAHITLDGSNTNHVLMINSGKQIYLNGFQLLCGTSIEGRCIENAGTLTIEEVDIKDGNLGIGSSLKNTSTGQINIKTYIGIK